jgi:hypothetical protein
MTASLFPFNAAPIQKYKDKHEHGHTHERKFIIIRNAHANNLKRISLEIPKHKAIAFTGVSGSGKPSLLFDTIYTEAQRQLIETFSTFARKRLPKLSRPDVDDILNLSTAMVIDQKEMGADLRSTVGTATDWTAKNPSATAGYAISITSQAASYGTSWPGSKL